MDAELEGNVIMRRYAASLLVVLINLAACGGGGGGSAASPVVGSSPQPVIPQSTPSQTSNSGSALPRATAASVGVSQAKVDVVLNHIFTDAATQTVLVSKNGVVIGERYADGYGANSLGTSWSVAKSFYSAAIGVAIAEGHFSSVSEKASVVLDEFVGTDKEHITLEQILRMRSGLAANTNVFFSGDQTAHALANTLTRAPDSAFNYSNANSQLFEPLLRRATGLDAHNYLSQKILQPIGIDLASVGLWMDETGTQPMTYCCIDMRADDFLRFGLLYAQEGRWDGVQVVPQSYVAASLNPVGFYGYQWWAMNQTYFNRAVSGDIRSAIGLHGQRILISPNSGIVVVVLTKYQHFANQGYVLNTQLNFPDTCSARNNCPSLQPAGPEVPSYNLYELVGLVAALGEE